MKRIGIVTFHRAINYGAMLQAVALQNAISELGFVCEIVDYVDELYDHYKINYASSNVIKSILKYTLYKNSRIRNRRFEDFLLNNSSITKRQYNKSSISEIKESEYNLFITGSDQTMNPEIVNYDDNYLLSFVKEKRKCNSYAGSIGLSELTEEQRKWLLRGISGYNHLLMREKTGLDMLEELGFRNTALVCDPTFLLSAPKWKKMWKQVKTPNHYILYYGFKRNEWLERKAASIAEKTGYSIYTISDSIRKDERGYKKFRGIGPGEWLYLISHADFVVTNSFHGMIFSFIFNRQVWIGDSNDGTFSRMEDFLSVVECNDRIVSKDTLMMDSRIDFSKVNRLMEEYIGQSRRKILDVIEEYK